MAIEIIENIKLDEADKTELKEFVKRTVEELSGEIFLIKLFGSSVRNELTKDSDIDILVVVKERTLPLFNRIEDIAIDASLKYGGQVISIKLIGEKHYQLLRQLETPFIKNVEREGITLWKKT